MVDFFGYCVCVVLVVVFDDVDIIVMCGDF